MKNKILALLSVCSVMTLALLGSGCSLNDARTLGADLANRGLTEADCESFVPAVTPDKPHRATDDGDSLRTWGRVDARSSIVAACREGFRAQMAFRSGAAGSFDLSSSMRGSHLANSGAPISDCGSEDQCRTSALGFTSDETEASALVASCLASVHDCRRGFTAASIMSGRSDAGEPRCRLGRCL